MGFVQTLKLTPENVTQFVGSEIIFKTRTNHIIKRILGISKTGKSIIIDHPDLNNSLQIVSRIVKVIIV
jgi:hypothetical protein